MSSCAKRHLPLTCAQQELWLAHEALPEQHPGISCGGQHILDRCPDPQLIRRCLTLLLQHFPLLSATLQKTSGAMPQLVPGTHPEPAFEVIDLRRTPAARQAAQDYLDQFREQPFAPCGGHLCHFALVLIDDDCSWFLNRVFHPVADGMACLAQFYLVMQWYEELHTQGKVDPGPACLWDEDVVKDQSFRASARAARDVAFWRDHLTDLPPERLFKPRPGRPDVIDTIGRHEQDLDPVTAGHLRELAATFEAAPAEIFMAAHAMVLARLYDGDRLGIQVPLRFGERRDLRRMQGHRVNISPLILDLAPNRTFATVLEQTRQQLRSLRRHARTPFQHGLRAAGRPATPQHIWDTNVNYIPRLADNEVQGWGPWAHGLLTLPITSRYEPVLLGVYLLDMVEGKPHLSIDYSRNHFSAEDVANYVRRLAQLLDEVRQNPARAIGGGDGLLPAERAALAEWQQGPKQPCPRETIPAFFDRVANRDPLRAAVMGQTGPERTYGKLKRLSDGVALWLTRSGVRPGQVVGVLARRHPDLAQTILGIMKAGAVYLPLDPDYPLQRIRHMLDDSGAGIVLALDTTDRAVDLGPLQPRSLPAELPAGEPVPHGDDQTPAYLIYTSGSTGRPKGVLVPHRGFVNMIHGQIAGFGIRPGDRVLQFASPSFDASLSEIFMALLSGACLCPVDRALLDDPRRLRDYMAERGITVATLPPSYLRLYNRDPFPGLRILITAGEAPVLADARHYAAQLAYFNAYGPTEASVCASLSRVLPGDQEPWIGVGRPLPNTRAYILDRRGRQVAPGVPGELYLAGAGLALGYHARPELNRERFLSSPAAPGERLYRTGDRAAWSPEGEIVLLGRIDEQVKIRGHRVEPGEVTATLEGHPDIAQAAVLAVTVAEGRSELVACLVARDGADVSHARLVDWLSHRLPVYMVPSRWHRLDALPVTPTGKIDRAALLQLDRDATPAADKTGAPRTVSRLEAELRGLFEAVLERAVPNPDADFFTLGGDSLKAMELVHRIAAHCACNLSVRDFMAGASIAAVARLVDGRRQPADRATEPLALPLSQGQLQLWTEACLAGPTPRYNMPLALELRADAATAQRFGEALLQAIANQPICRCAVAGEIDAPRLQPTELSALRIEHRDLRREEDPAGAVRRLFDARIHEPFDLTRAPLLRIVLARLDTTRWQLLLVMHHIIGDGESLRILLRDALRRLAGEPPQQVPAAALQRFVEAEKSYLNAPASRADLTFWKERLTPPPPRLDLVPGHPRPPLKSGIGNLLRCPLGAIGSDLQRLAEQTGTTLLETFTGLLMRYLRQRTGCQDVAVAVPVGLRDAAELFDAAGYFVNTVIVRDRETCGGERAVSLRAAAARLREAVEHSRYPFALLPAALDQRRDPSRAPLVDVMATHIDTAALLTATTAVDGVELAPLDVSLRAAKLDFTFILHSRSGTPDQLVLEYDSDLASATQAEEILTQLADFIGACARTEHAPRPDATAAPTDLLAQAWQEILGGGPPDPENNFFACGGDSIKAIQLVGLLRRRGLSALTPAQIFAHPTLGALQEQLTRAEAPATVAADSGPRPGDPIPLLPIQRQLLAAHPEHWRAFYMVLPMRLAAPVDITRLRQGLAELPVRHEALRMAFSDDGTAQLLKTPPAPVWEKLTFPASDDRAAAFRQAAQHLFARLDPTVGRTCGAVLVCHGEDHLLLLGGHHLVLDAVSLDLLRRELAWYVRQGCWPPGDEGTGAATWAMHLASRAEADLDQQASAFWQRLCATPAAPLHRLRHAERDRVARRTACRRRVTGLDRLRGPVSRADLLAALARALHLRGQSDTLFMTLEGHGREALAPGRDVSQAVGWFTVTYPLPLTPATDMQDTATALEKWFAQLPHGGAGYGLAAGRHPEALRYRPQIALNYLGQIFPEAAQDGFEVQFEQAAPDALPGLLHADFRPDAPLDLIVLGETPDTLQLTAYFGPECLDRDWVEGLLATWAEALQQRCGLPESYRALLDNSQCAAEDVEAITAPNAAQESMLFQHLLDNGTAPTYTQQINFRLAGALDPDHLTQAWHGLLDRHQSLRNLFPTAEDGTFHCLTLRRGRSLVDRIDLSRLSAPQQTAQRQRLLQQQRQTPFDLAAGPLLRLQLLHYGADANEMSWCFHHLLMDGWCVGILLRELFAAYAALRRGDQPDLTPPPPLQRYRRWRGKQDEAAAQNYWRGLLQDAVPGLLTAADAAPSDPRETLRERELRLDARTSAALQAAAAHHGASLPHLLQALWGLLLGSRQGARRDVLFGLVVAGRPAAVEGIEEMVGLFIQTLPVRLCWQPEHALRELVAAIRQQAADRAPHEFYPLADIQRTAASEGPLFDHILVFENYPLDGIARKDAPRISAVSGFEQHPYAFGLSVVPGEELVCRFSYRPSRFSEAQVSQLTDQWQALLQSVAEKRDLPCDTLETLLQGTPPPDEQAAPVPEHVNRTARPYPRKDAIGTLLRRVAATHATGKALIGADGQAWSYRELDRVSDTIAANLPALTVGEPVALAMPRGPEAVAAMLGILKAGGCYLPLDEKNPPARIGRMLRIADCRHVIVHAGEHYRFDPQPLQHLAQLPYAQLTQGKAAPPPERADGGQPAYVMFTSGSTGEPKGVVVPHRAVARLVLNSDFWDIDAGERLLQAGPLGFDASTLEIWGALLHGGTVCFISDEQLLSPGGLRRRIAADRITLMWLTSSLCNLLADEDPGLFAPLRRLFTGGEALSPAHMRKIMAACPELELCNGYGPTENTTFTTVHRITAEDLEGPTIPIGRPIANTRVYILDEEDRIAPFGAWGEICAAGDGLALGYIGRDDLTREAFVQLPTPIGERVYRTGDIGRWRADGVIEFQGRRDGQVKLRGYRIELSEIEAALGALPQVRQAAVVAPGSGEERSLVAFVGGTRQTPAQLKAALEETLPSYMLPDRIVCLEALPLTKNGKLDREALTRRGGAQVPAERCAARGQGDRLEERIAGIFGEVLGLPVSAPEADFFQLGGHSLKAMRLLARLNHRLDAGLSLRDVMTHTSVAALANRIRGGTATAPPADPGPVPVGEQQDYPLASGQERLWFLQRMQPGGTVYNVPFAVYLPGAPDRTALQQALGMLEQRHAALRLRLPDSMGEGALRQRLAPPGALRLACRDLSEARDPAAAVREALTEALARPFAFGYGEPLARVCLLRETADSCVLLLTMHHAICDGWSGEQFLKDLPAAYAAALEGTTPPWPEAPLRYVDYACWQQDFLAGPGCEALRERWRERLHPLPEALQLPTDRPRPPVRSFEGAVYRFALDGARLAALKHCAGRCDATLFPVLMALVKTFLYRHTGQHDLVVGVPVAGRPFAQLEDLFGFFVNTVPLRDRLAADDGFEPLVEQVRDNLREALSDQLYPLEALVNDLQLPREGSRNPLFDVLVALEDDNWSRLPTDGPLPMRACPLPHRHSKLDLSFYFRELPEGLSVHIEYSSDLFDAATVERMAERFRVLTDAVLREPGRPLAELELMPAPERQQVVQGFNDTAVDWRLDTTIDRLFARQAQQTPHAAALRACDGSILSFAELDRQVEALAAHLQAAGVTPGTCVGVCFERSVELMTAIFAVLRAGAVYVPFAPGLPAQRIAAMAEDLGEAVILTRPELAAPFAGLGLTVLTPQEADRFHAPAADPGAAAYIIFTSGSTGRPKGVVVEHRSVLNRIWWMQSRFPLQADDVILQKTHISFDVSVWELFWWSWTGASLAQLAPGEEKDPAAIVAAVACHKATVMHFVPSMLRMFLDHLEQHPKALPQLATLRLVFASGEALTSEIAARFNRLLHAAHGTALHNLYGPTEATVDVTWYPCSPAVQRPSVPIGKPVSNTRLYVLDPTGRPVPVGVAGELFISGVQVARGYINRPELTAERFLPDPFVPEARMYRTGDLGRWLPSGDIEYLGRTDHQVKVRGFRIELGEIEAALERIETVTQAVVRVGRISGMDSLEAFLVPAAGAELKPRTLRRRLGELLPDYMIPAVFYRLESIPLNSSGKADRKALRGQKLRLANDAQAPAEKLPPAERALAELWRQVLPEAPRIGLDDNFFELGGNSLLLIRLHELLENAWPGRFALAELFVSVTIRQQAAHLEVAAAATPSTTQQSRNEAAPDRDDAVAVIGMALRLGDMETPEALWAELAAGGDRTGPLSSRRRRELSAMLAAIGVTADPRHFREAAFLEDISGFDCRRFGMAPSDARLLDPEQRLFLETAWRALEDAGYGGPTLDGAQVGIFVGASPSQTFKEAVSRSFPERAEQAYILNVPSSLATRIGYLKDWRGPATLIDTACSSALKALHDACRSLLRGECALALAGGARVLLAPLRGEERFNIETTTGQTRTFDAAADGVGAGEGAVAFLLKPLARAVADGDAIRAVIRGGAINQDGRSASIAAPNPVAQADVIRAAAADAGVALESLDFFEAHGTGTALGDPIEIDGLTRAFKAPPTPRALIGSVKGNVGHLDAAAGAIGVAKAILTLQQGEVPRQPYFEQPNPRIDFDRAPVTVPRENQPLDPARRPWRCGVSAFGLSGINVHLILQQAPARNLAEDDGRWYVVPLSAGSAQGLQRYAEAVLQALAARPDWPLRAVAATLITGREHLPYRLAIPARNRQELRDGLLAWRLDTPAETLRETPATDATVPLADLDDASAARQAAEAYLGGAAPSWPAASPVLRLHLPTVPMERIACWPSFVPQAATIQNGLLGAAVDSPRGRLHAVPVAAPHFWPMAEHRLGNRPTLVGMAMIALLAEALAPLPPGQSLTIENLSWLRPLVLDEIDPDSATLSLEDGEGSLQAELGARLANGAWAAFARAGLRFGETVAERHDPARLRNGLRSRAVPPPPAEAAPIQVSARWDCRQTLWRSADGRTTLARLRLPEDYLADLQQTGWHPALLDVAASLALDRPGLVPACVGEIRLHRPLTASLLAHLVRRAPDADDAGEALHVDCRLLDEAGTLLAELRDLVFVPLPQPRARLHRLEWRALPAGTPASVQPNQQPPLVIGDGPLAEALRRAPEAAAWRYRPMPQNDAARAALVAELLDGAPAPCLYLVPQREHDPWSLPALLKTLLGRGLRRPLQLLAAGAGALADGDAAAASPPAAALDMGVLLALSREEPLLQGRYVDLAAGVPAAALCAELAAAPPQDLAPARLTPEGRFVQELSKPLPETATTATDDDGDGCVVITGGLGAMALTLAAAGFGARPLALLHRGAFAPEAQWPQLAAGDDPRRAERAAALLELRRREIPFKLYACDVTCRAALDTTLQQVRAELGAIGGVLHTAGVAGDGFLLHKDRAVFEAVLAPKVDAVRHLHALTLDDPLRFFVLASSRTALTGAPGQTDYTAANAYLDAFAHWRRQQELPALAIDWNSWDRIGMAARSGQLDPARPALPPQQAGPLLRQALASGAAQVVVSMPGEDLARSTDSRPPQPSTARTTDPSLPLEQRVMQIVAEGLGYDTPLAPEDDFYALGGDSITGMQIIGRINRELERSLSLADLFSHSRLGRFIERVRGGAAADPAAEIVAAPAQERYPVSWEQLAVLQAEATASPHTGYNLPQFMSLPAACDVPRLAQAVTRLVARHEILRTRFRDLDRELPTMEVLPAEPVLLEEHFLDRFEQNAAQALVRPFALEQAPLFRACVLHTGNEGDLLFFDIHHAVADARTIDILLGELWTLYRGQALGDPPPQQKDAAWLQHQQESTDRDAARRYWLERFEGALPLLALPADHERPPRHTHRGATHNFEVPAAWLPAIRALAREHATTTYNLMLSLWGLLLGRYTGSDELVIAVAADSRDREALAGTTGMFVSLLPLRLRLSAGESFAQLLLRNHHQHADALRYRGFSLNRLLNALRVPVMPDRTPLAEVTFSYMNFESVRQQPEEFAAINVANPACKADLAIFASDAGEHLSFALEYYADLFDAPRMQRMGAHFLQLLEQLIAQGAQTPLARLRLLDEAQTTALKSFENGPPLAAAKSLEALLGEAARDRGETLACGDGDTALNWAELETVSRRVAGRLVEAGVVAGDGVLLPAGGAELVPLALGVLRAGACCLPADRRPDAQAAWTIGGDAGDRSLPNPAGLLQPDGAVLPTALPAVKEDCPALLNARADDAVRALRHADLLALAAQLRACGLEAGTQTRIVPGPDHGTGLTLLLAAVLAGAVPQNAAALSAVLLADAAHLARGEAAGCRRLILLADDPLDAAGTAAAVDADIVVGLRAPGTPLLMSVARPGGSDSPFLEAGRPAAGVRIAITDCNGAPAPIGVWGQLRLGGAEPATDIVGRWREDGVIELRGTLRHADHDAVRLHRAVLALEGVRDTRVTRLPDGAWRIAVTGDATFDAARARRTLRRTLPVRFASLTFEDTACAAAPPQAATGDDTGKVLALFREFFNDPAIGPEESFFELGGHSLLALQMVNRLARDNGCALTIRDLFEHPSPAELADLLRQGTRQSGPIPPAAPAAGGRFPLSHAQQRLYVLHHTDGGAAAYNMAFVFRIAQPLNPQRLRQALQRLCARHETLRTAFVEKGGQLWQQVQAEATPPCAVDQLPEDGLHEALARFRRDAAEPFDLRVAPLLRVRLCRLGEDSNLLSLVMHHIVGDGWSMQLFFGELAALYETPDAPLPALPIQYRDYAVWQQGKNWQGEADYWRATLRNAPQRIALPADAAPSCGPLAAGVVTHPLPDALMERLRGHAKRKGVSLATLCLTLFTALLYRLTRQRDMVLGMGVAGRERAELEGLIGFFINILPIRVRMDDDTELDDLLDQVHRACLEALERQDYPFDLLVRELAPARGAQREALLNVMFEYQRYSDLQRINTLRPDAALRGSLLETDAAAPPTDAGGPSAKYDLTLFVQDEPGGCRLKAEFDRQVLTAATVTSWLAYLEAFMHGITQQERRPDYENI